MNSRASRRVRTVTPIRLADRRPIRIVDTPPEREATRNSLEDFLASVANRWRGHEAEIAILGTATLIIAVAAVAAGADVLFTILISLVAVITIWSPWHQPR